MSHLKLPTTGGLRTTEGGRPIFKSPDGIWSRSRSPEIRNAAADLKEMAAWGAWSAWGGPMSYTWFGATPRVNILDPELIDILLNKFGYFSKIKEKLVSNGTCEVNVWPDIQRLTADVISRTAFGRRPTDIQLQTEHAKLIVGVILFQFIPGFRFLPTKKNRRIKEIDREVRSILSDMINKRENATKYGEAHKDDLLGMLLDSNRKHIQENDNPNKFDMTIKEVIEESEGIEVEPSRTVEEGSEPNNLKPSLIVKEGEGVHSGLDIENEISM
ncbi:hypothetical protein Scep_028266 [Stephania cephalantha]|uniref:Cytochrome P450 n=1 Tax=Stephania cephalantha TaxID=152367 RepID=A0AAP0EHZ7_9MAGN